MSEIKSTVFMSFQLNYISLALASEIMRWIDK